MMIMICAVKMTGTGPPVSSRARPSVAATRHVNSSTDAVFTLARGYIKKLLDNAKVVRFLNTNHSDILSEFESITAAESL